MSNENPFEAMMKMGQEMAKSPDHAERHDGRDDGQRAKPRRP